MVETFFGEAGPIGLSPGGQPRSDAPTVADIVMQLGHGFEWFYFNSLRAATARFAAGATRTAVVRE